MVRSVAPISASELTPPRRVVLALAGRRNTSLRGEMSEIRGSAPGQADPMPVATPYVPDHKLSLPSGPRTLAEYCTVGSNVPYYRGVHLRGV